MTQPAETVESLLHLYGDICGQIALSRITVPDRNTRIREEATTTKAKLRELIEQVIGEDEMTIHKGIVGMTNYEANRNSLRFEQRKRLDLLFGASTEGKE